MLKCNVYLLSAGLVTGFLCSSEEEGWGILRERFAGQSAQFWAEVDIYFVSQ